MLDHELNPEEMEAEQGKLLDNEQVVDFNLPDHEVNPGEMEAEETELLDNEQVVDFELPDLKEGGAGRNP